jgi:actin-related protein 9
MSALSPPDTPHVEPCVLQETLLDLVKQIWEDGLVRVPSDGETAVPEDEGVTDIAAVLVAGRERAVIESGMKKRATAKASAAEQARAREIEAFDLITVHFRGRSLTLGKERHRFCEPLFDPSLLNGLLHVQQRTSTEAIMALQESVGHAVGQAEVDQRQYMWSGLFITGELANRVKGKTSRLTHFYEQLIIILSKGIGTALQSRLAPYILSNPDQQTDVQPRYIRVITVPDYFAEYRDKGDGLAAFLGSSIVAKVGVHPSILD